jgi:hypothetical protein
MTNFKNTVAAITLMAVMVLTTTVANAGLIVSDRSTPATTCETKPTGSDWGILVSDLVEGIIVAGFTGIIVAGRTDGIIVAGRTDGIIVAGRETPNTGCNTK